MVLAGITGTLACALWFVGRARLGVRVRTLAGVRLRTHDRAAALIARVSPGRGLLGALGGMAFGGQVIAAVAAVAGCAWKPLATARDARVRARRLEAQIPETLRALSAGLRAGRSLPQALAGAFDDAVPPVRDALDAALRRSSVGAPLDEALKAFADHAGCASAVAAVETLRIGRAAGANLPSIIDVMVESLAERDRLARDRRAATSQARLSAAVVASMPAAFFLLLGKSARAQVAVLFGTPVGWVLLGLGLALEAGGVFWMRSMVRA